MSIAPIHPKARTVALVGHTGSGKTSLLEALVVATGGLDRAGRVDDGTSLVGHDPEERKHKTSLGIATAPLWVGDDKLTILDTPGFPDFHGEVVRALDICDVAVLVVSAVQGVGVDTITTWRLARREDVPVVVFINALDADRAQFESTLTQLESLIGPSLAPLELPIGEGESFTGIADLLADEAITYVNGSAHAGPIPEALAELEHRVRASLLEAIVVGDDTLTERYLDGDAPTMDELKPVLSAMMVDGRIVPLTVGSSITGVGIDRLATLLDEIAVSRPIPALESDLETLLDRSPEGAPILRAFKVIMDPYVGRIVVVEVVSGTLAPETTLVNTRTHSEEKIHTLNYLMGSKLVPVTSAVAGDVLALAKLGPVSVGDVLGPKGREIKGLSHVKTAPALTVAVAGSSRDDDDKIATSLQRLSEEDPSLVVRHDAASRRLVIDVMGDTHLQVTLERLRRRFNVEATIAPPPIPLYETINKSTEVEGRLKKQTGGHGQFAVVNLRVEPVPTDQPFEFVDATVGGSVPKQFIGAVRNGCEKAMTRGGPAGYPVVGIKVTLTDGKSHSVDSSEAAFETAASMGVRAALDDAGTTVLEPVHVVKATVPPESLGDVLNDLNTRRGRVLGTDQSTDDEVVISAHVPESELQRYGLDLRSITGGRGVATIELHHLAEAPRVLAGNK
jgi:elongation factor G